MNVDQSDDSGTQDESVGRDHIVVEGETPVTLPVTHEMAAASFDLSTPTIRFQCASGDWLEDDWAGIPVELGGQEDPQDYGDLQLDDG